MMKSLRASMVSVALACGAAGGIATTACAQTKPSEFATVSQTTSGAVITVTYSRPSVKGRNPVFGGLVRYGDTWTPGANQSTTLEVTHPVKIDGHDVPKGKYSVWMIPRDGAWTVFLDPNWGRFHTNRPDSTSDQVRWQATPEDAPATEFLTWSFPEVRADGVLLAMAWGTKRVVLNVVLSGR